MGTPTNPSDAQDTVDNYGDSTDDLFPSTGTTTPTGGLTGTDSSPDGWMGNVLGSPNGSIQGQQESWAAWAPLRNAFPNSVDLLRQMWKSGMSFDDAQAQLEKRNKQREKKGKEKVDPQVQNYMTIYAGLWGEQAPEAELQKAQAEGWNTYEFMAYQRSKTAFKDTEVYKREASALGAGILNTFGFGMNLSQSASPTRGDAY